MPHSVDHLHEPVTAFMRADSEGLNQSLTVAQALEQIRSHGVSERIVYFYVVDDQDRLVGVLPTRNLLVAQPEASLQSLMIPRVVAVPHTATLGDACELFVFHRYLAFPVVDEDRRLLGILDVSLFTNEVLNLAEKEQRDSVFEAIGVRINTSRTGGFWSGFRNRFPWLLTTILSGLACAGLTARYEVTLQQSLALAFFLTLVLGLGESVSVQSMTLTIQALRSRSPSWKWFFTTLRRELGVASALALSCGSLVSLIVWWWRHDLAAAGIVGSSITLAVLCSCIIGLLVPSLLHSLRWDPKIAAGPITLALADVATLLWYFNVAQWILQAR